MVGGAREASQCKPKSWQGLQKDGWRNIALTLTDQRSKRVIVISTVVNAPVPECSPGLPARN
jgi:nitrogen regulatory protein PII-like uncharacterized protein